MHHWYHNTEHRREWTPWRSRNIFYSFLFISFLKVKFVWAFSLTEVQKVSVRVSCQPPSSFGMWLCSACCTLKTDLRNPCNFPFVIELFVPDYLASAPKSRHGVHAILKLIIAIHRSVIPHILEDVKLSTTCFVFKNDD